MLSFYNSGQSFKCRPLSRFTKHHFFFAPLNVDLRAGITWYCSTNFYLQKFVIIFLIRLLEFLDQIRKLVKFEFLVFLWCSTNRIFVKQGLATTVRLFKIRLRLSWNFESFSPLMIQVGDTMVSFILSSRHLKCMPSFVFGNDAQKRKKCVKIPQRYGHVVIRVDILDQAECGEHPGGPHKI